MRFRSGGSPDRRRYNTPSARTEEVAIVFSGEGPPSEHYTSMCSRADVALEGNATHEVSRLSEHIDPLSYLLIHVCGSLGWSTMLRSFAGFLAPGAKRTRISLSELCARRLMIHVPNAVNAQSIELPLEAGRLTRQCIIDAYGKIEADRLQYIRDNQDKLRVDTLQGLADFMQEVDPFQSRPSMSWPQAVQLH